MTRTWRGTAGVLTIGAIAAIASTAIWFVRDRPQYIPVFLALAAIALAADYLLFAVRLDQRGITNRGLRGATHVPWSDVVAVGATDNTLWVARTTIKTSTGARIKLCRMRNFKELYQAVIDQSSSHHAAA